ncbi:MAG: helix-turn-helix transcriptional regulator [Bacteroidales bacterium]|nr:helix-turn-helix transcriptional regulator [Bacteroidales bacterium]
MRELRNYTQEHTAACLGISQANYSRIESGQTKFDIQRMQQNAGVLEVDPVMLISYLSLCFYSVVLIAQKWLWL